MPTEDGQWMARLKKGLRGILSSKISLREAESIHGITRRTFKRYIAHYNLVKPLEVRFVEKIEPGAPPYLNASSLTVLTLFGHALDSLDLQLTFETWREKIFAIKKEQHDECGPSTPISAPCDHTVHDIIEKLKLPRKFIREGPSIDALRESKATPKYLCDYFDKLEEVFQDEKITPDRIWNCDEVGIQLSDMKLHVYSTKKTVRRNLCTDHLTAHLTVSAEGKVLPLFLIFPGECNADIPESITNHPDVWSATSPNGWMDEERFQAYMLLYIRKINELREKTKSTCSHILLLDGHSSRYNIDTLWTAAVNRIIVFFGPSQLTNCWQANDSGTNKKWKDNIKKELGPKLEAKVPILPADLADMVQKAIQYDDIPRTIQNSFRHVGVWPTDRSVIERMIKDEKPTLSKLDEEIQKAIPIVVDHVLKINSIRENYEKEREKSKETKKKRKRTFDTSFACIGTASDRMAMLSLNKEEAEVRKLKVEPLRSAMMEKMGFPAEQLKNGQKWKTKDELLDLVEVYYSGKVSELNETISGLLEKELSRFPSVTPCATLDLGPSTPSKRSRTQK